MAEESERSPERALAWLASLPIPEHDYEAQAAAIEARLHDVLPGSTEARWLEAPLPDAPGEGSLTAPDEPQTAPAPIFSASRAREGSESESAAPPAAASTAEASKEGTEALAGGRSDAAASGARPAGSAAGGSDAAASEERALALAGSAEGAAEPARPRGSASSAPPPPSSSGDRSLAALARSVAQKGARPQSNELAKESLSVAAAARAHTDFMVERVRGSRSDPAPKSSRRQSGAPSSVAPGAPAVPSQPPHARDLRGPWLAVAAIGFAAAAAVFFMGRARDATPLSQVAQAPARPAAKAEARLPAKGTSNTPTSAAPLAAAPSDSVSSDGAKQAAATAAIPASASPLAALDAPGEPVAARTRASGVTARAPAKASKAGLSPAPNPRPAPEAVVLHEAPAQVAEQSSASGAASALHPASGAPSGGLPDKPATGAVQAAIGSVMGPARACLAGSTAAAPAQVTFGSTGIVKSVSVTGPSAGSPAAACVEAALRRARVAPFADESFSLSVWVRP